MIDCYTWITDNGYKPRMMLEETGLAHKIVPVNLREKAQMAPDFMKISPGHKIPAIVDHDGPGGAEVTICESGAILKYLGGEVRQVLSERRSGAGQSRSMAVLRLRDVHDAGATVRALDHTFAGQSAARARALRGQPARHARHPRPASSSRTNISAAPIRSPT